MPTLADFQAYIGTFTHSTAGRDIFGDPANDYWFNADPGFDDFNKEIAVPGILDGFPDGVVGIRSDDDFWTEAVFPYEYRDIPIADLVSVLWPHIENPTLHPDVKTYPWQPGQCDHKEPNNGPAD